jgi:hypothetical protein
VGGLPRRPVGGDVAGGAEELGQVFVEKLLGACLGHMDGEVHGGADGTVAVSDRDRDGADAGGEAFVGDGPAAGANPGELVVEGQ